MTTRGKKQLLKYGNDLLSITDVLKIPGVSEYIQRNGPLTDGSLRNRLRRENFVGSFTRKAVKSFYNNNGIDDNGT